MFVEFFLRTDALIAAYVPYQKYAFMVRDEGKKVRHAMFTLAIFQKNKSVKV